MEHEDEGYNNCSWCGWKGPQGLGKVISATWNQRNNQDHPVNNIVKIP